MKFTLPVKDELKSLPLLKLAIMLAIGMVMQWYFNFPQILFVASFFTLILFLFIAYKLRSALNYSQFMLSAGIALFSFISGAWLMHMRQVSGELPETFYRASKIQLVIE